MIKYFAIENYRSFKDEQIFELDLNLDKNAPYVAQPTLGIAGANASGKSNLLQALSFVLWFMQDSFLDLDENEDIPCPAFMTRRGKPSRFHLIFTQTMPTKNEPKLIDFEYELKLTEKKVIAEKLFYYPSGRRKIKVYSRNGNKIQYGKNISPIKERDLRVNCSIVSFAVQFASQEIASICRYYKFSTNLIDKEDFETKTFLHKELETKTFLHKELKAESSSAQALIKRFKEKDQLNKVSEMIRMADVGIEKIDYSEMDREKLPENLEKIAFFYDREEIKREGIDEQLKFFQKSCDNLLRIIRDQAIFKHKIDNHLKDFTPDLESAGTLQFLIVLSKVIDALDNGYLVILDEIELKLHQNLVAYIIGLFQNPSENKQGGQLIFSFHNTFFMEFLTPEQLWFTEKNEQGYTELFSAAAFEGDIKELYQKDLEMLYRVGRFGAKPRGL